MLENVVTESGNLFSDIVRLVVRELNKDNLLIKFCPVCEKIIGRQFFRTLVSDRLKCHSCDSELKSSGLPYWTLWIAFVVTTTILNVVVEEGPLQWVFLFAICSIYVAIFLKALKFEPVDKGR